MKQLFLPWHSFDLQKKNQLYTKYSCHELNFFLFRKDKEFYESVVKDFIKNKMEKTFVDWYLLGIEQESNNIFVQKVLYYIEGICRHEDLNAFEFCLLVDMCWQKGNEKQKEKAKLKVSNL